MYMTPLATPPEQDGQNWVQALLEHAARPEIALACGQVERRPDDKIQVCADPDIADLRPAYWRRSSLRRPACQWAALHPNVQSGSAALVPWWAANLFHRDSGGFGPGSLAAAGSLDCGISGSQAGPAGTTGTGPTVFTPVPGRSWRPRPRGFPGGSPGARRTWQTEVLGNGVIPATRVTGGTLASLGPNRGFPLGLTKTRRKGTGKKPGGIYERKGGQWAWRLGYRRGP